MERKEKEEAAAKLLCRSVKSWSARAKRERKKTECCQSLMCVDDGIISSTTSTPQQHIFERKSREIANISRVLNDFYCHRK